MLDTDTKRRIDAARNMLVGKVPDPKSQVEQITIALIYKFMDDMDAEAEELGGKRSFFAGEYAKYGWAKLLAVGMEGHEMLGLYAEGIARMPENMGIPQLFRDIFKNAYLPYRDPETLKSFLKIINEFSYDHSERLGDAFEYLLSVLGSQGDAGQFRTPRHIIDFMVEVMQPKLGEVVLDPACGTAGFLISAYKHILQNNTDAGGASTLSSAAKGKLATHFKGYDISPDMVRLSRANLYLHGFVQPQIFEYDTLTSTDKWNESADVILANPPFMSPKGGIKPHNKFSIAAKRSEVLFVDYIAEHLSPQGRAAIIVPEGIIFQSQGAYKDLRKMLVENSLVAVISLPAGVFQPYSGVKTSILILDKTLAKQAEGIAFFKIENDGFGLGAQRRAIAKNDLPNIEKALSQYLQGLRANNSLQALSDMASDHDMVVSKDKIALSGDYNLSGERYREGAVSTSSFPSVVLGEICELVRGVVFSKSDEVLEGGVKVLRAGNINKDRYELDLNDIKQVQPKADFSGEKKLKQNDLFICLASGSKDHVGKVAFIKEDTDFYFGGFMGAIRVKPEALDPIYLLKQLTTGHFNDFLREQIAGANINNLSSSLLYRFSIPLPPLDIQKQIVAEIEGYQKVIDGARAVVDNYRPRIDVQADWPMLALGTVCETISDGDHQAPPKSEHGVPFVTISNINDNELDFTKTYYVPEAYYANLSHTRKPQGGDVLYTVTGSYGIPVLVPANSKFCFQRHIALIRTGETLFNKFLYCLLLSPFMIEQGHDAATGVAQKTVSLGALRNFQIPLPPLPIQQSIVAEIEAEQALVAANRELIVRFEAKIAKVLARVWGE